MMRRTGFKPKWPDKPATTRAPAVSAKPDTSRFRMMEKVIAQASTDFGVEFSMRDWQGYHE